MSIEHPGHIITGILIGYLTSMFIGLYRRRRAVIAVTKLVSGDVRIHEGGTYTPVMAKLLADVIIKHADMEKPYDANQ